MVVGNEITGRFLPSRAYGRWKWAVRFGLLIVPSDFPESKQSEDRP
jgi:hypothetical protein